MRAMLASWARKVWAVVLAVFAAASGFYALTGQHPLQLLGALFGR